MPMTRMEIEHIIGRVDDHIAAEIAGTQANVEELTKARAWLDADEARINEGDSLPSGKIAELIGILETVEDEEDAPVPAGEAPGAEWA